MNLIEIDNSSFYCIEEIKLNDVVYFLHHSLFYSYLLSGPFSYDDFGDRSLGILNRTDFFNVLVESGFLV